VLQNVISVWQIQLEACRQEMAEKAALLLEASTALETLETKIRQMETEKQLESPITEGSAGGPAGFRLLPPPPSSAAADHRRRLTASPSAGRKGFLFSEDLANNNNNNMMLKEADRLALAVLEETGTST
jgi:hypothetical protein